MAIATTAQTPTIAYLMKDGVPHIEDATCATLSLCGEACGRHAHLDGPGKAEVCATCVGIAARLAYRPAA
ncbi:hypothetical protein [Nonomuraea sp. NPDC005650]|uniref:hypothetical protein n=1 Tax=Nonomuraea sp. NPDC005650 TaxID=3157045 RepID=UPI0033ACA7CD